MVVATAKTLAVQRWVQQQQHIRLGKKQSVTVNDKTVQCNNLDNFIDYFSV